LSRKIKAAWICRRKLVSFGINPDFGYVQNYPDQ